jgi:hypothetical protein
MVGSKFILLKVIFEVRWLEMMPVNHWFILLHLL